MCACMTAHTYTRAHTHTHTGEKTEAKADGEHLATSGFRYREAWLTVAGVPWNLRALH